MSPVTETKKSNWITYTEERVPIRSAMALIESISVLPSDTGRRRLEHLIEQESQALTAAYCEREYAELHEATAGRDQARARAEQTAADLVEAESAKRRTEEDPDPGWVRTLICALCALACFAAEFALTWQALTFVLNVPKHSTLGVLLGLAPPSALAVLELILLRMIERPWQRLRHAAGMSTWRRMAAAGTMLLFLTALGWGNLYTVMLLAEAREEAAKAQYNLMREDNQEVVEVDRDAINRAILAVSVCVTLDGALFLLLAFEEGNAFRDRRRARRVFRLARSSYDAATKALLEGEAKLSTVQVSMQSLEAGAQVLAERFRHQCLFELEQRQQRLRCDTPTEQLVEFGLRGKIA